MRTRLLTTAIAGFALAALLGVLLPSDTAVHAEPPAFSDTGTREVPENTPPGVNIGVPVSATDPDETGADAIEFGNTLTYKLSGEDADKFDVDPSTGQLITKVLLDHENPRGGTANNSNDYLVTVTVDDGEDRNTPVTQDVRITVTDVNEPPLAPFPPVVVSGQDDADDTNGAESTTTLKVVWHPPVNTGRATLGDYQVEFKKTTEPSFGTVGVGSISDNTVEITGLRPDTSYQVRVRATNNDLQANDGPWSLVGTGSTNKESNKPPRFAQTAPHSLTMEENSQPGENVGGPVTADDADSRTLGYEFNGPDAGLFDFNTSTGQIRTKRGVTYNHEDPACGYPTACIYYVTVVASDDAGGSDALRVTITVADRIEPPSAPARPTVRPTANSRTSLDVSWSEPANTGPAITAYTVQYRLKGSSDIFSTNGVPATVTGTETTISGVDSSNADTPWLSPGMSYEVRVRATTAEGTGGWSPLGTGSTNAGNREPVFRDRNVDVAPVPSPTATTRELNENTQPGRPVGRAVVADDGDGDRRTYKLVAATPGGDANANEAAAAKFDINENTGQILTKERLNHEDEVCGYIPANDIPNPTIDTVCTYTVVVEVRDGLDANGNEEESETAADDKITVTITVKDVNEPPPTPTVVLSSPEDVTKLGVIWYTDNTGPPVTSYDLQYRQGSGSWSSDNCDYGTTTADDDTCEGIDPADNADSMADIEQLTVNTLYSVRMRAANVEGTSSWSTPVSARTNKNKSEDTPNVAPTFTNLDPTLDVNESHERRAQDVGSVVADDTDGSAWTYRLEGPNKNLFTIASTGLIRTRSGLNHEDPGCGYDATVVSTVCTYEVLVKVDDGQGASIFREFTISIQDVKEPPSVPSTPRVTATKDSGKKLDVTWSEPSNTGPPITDYDVQYREVGGSDENWKKWPHGADSATDATGNTTVKTMITGLDPRTTYEVEVRASNAEGTSGWSSAGRGTTNASNLRPSFDATTSLVTLSVDENTRAGQNVGSPVSATDNDGNRLTYTLEGPGTASFTILSSSGQIRTKSSSLNHEAEECHYVDDGGSVCRYSVTVKVDDGQRKGNSVAAKSVTIEVADVDELPTVRTAPRVVGIPGSTSSVRVTWDEPVNTGPGITDYDVQYGVAGSGGFTDWTHQGADMSTIITGLAAGTRYEVRVRARSDEGVSDYSRSGTGSPNPDVANRNPVFSGGARTLSVAEDTPSGDTIGDPITATDPDDDPVTYELEGTGAEAFDIDRSSGQIRTSAPLNHEERSSYSVTVRARDGRGGTSTAGVRINVTDVAEPPDAPLSPTVTAVSSTSLQVSWDAPDNTGPPITDYDYRYQGPTDTSWTEVANTTIAATTVTIEDLSPSTFYDVQVRATNAEGSSDWSPAGIGSTNAPGANNPPVFSDGASATRSVSANARSGVPIGLPVTATDVDSGDTLTYSLGGRDAASFAINTANGQLLTKSGVTLIADETYTVTVSADDGRDIASITVSIEAVAGPPNNPPVFSEGASATRNVRRNAPAGTAIGSPFTATDADTDDTITYTLEGADAASFDINGSTGQLTTRSGVTLDRASYTVEVVASDDEVAARITVTITIITNVAPTFASTTTSRSVSETASAGAGVGAPVTATDLDGDALTYTLGGADAGSFSIGGTTGQITVGSGTTLDYETRRSYTVVVTATDPSGESARITVTINVTDVGLGSYDSNDNNRIERSEVIAAVRDYFANRVDRSTVIELIRLYFSS